MCNQQTMLIAVENQLNQTDVLYISDFVDDVETSSIYAGYYHSVYPQSDREKAMIACMWKLAQRKMYLMQAERLQQEVEHIGFTEAELHAYMASLD
jgi:hypothetical protein